MTIISQIQGSKSSPDSSPYKSQLMRMKKCDAKRMLVMKRLESLTHNMNNEEYENTDIPLIQYQAKVNASGSPHSCIGVDSTSATAMERAPEVQAKMNTGGSPHSCNIGVDSTSAMERAPEVQANLSPEFPEFARVLLRSHVCSRCRLTLPKNFCDVHLPKHDETIVLVNESEQEYDINYRANRNALGGGWRGFALANKLIEGDVLVFQLVQPCKFKVYITRASELSEDLISDNEPATDQCGNETYNSGSKNVERIQLSESVVNFKDVKEFKEFTISVDGLILDSELATHLRKKYYELCRSQKMLLHENLIYGLNIKLTTGIISETVNIADAIRAVKTASSVNDLESWDKTLKAFEDLGMAVGFLRARIRMIIDIPREYQGIIESKRNEKARAEDEMRRLKEKPFEVEALIKSLDEDIDTLTLKSEGLGFVIRSVASAPW